MDLYMDGDTLYSQEGTTQGDPLAMPMYALATIPLIKKLRAEVSEVKQVWYADDAAGASTICSLKQWWDRLCAIGPLFGYHPNATKTWLITKEDLHAEAKNVFKDTDIQITTEGRPYLGVPLGTDEYRKSFLDRKVDQWKTETKLLATIAYTQPHAAYAAFTHGMASKWLYLSRTIENISPSLEPLEQTIRTELIPALTGRSPPNDIERNLLALPARFGGLALTNPTQATANEFCTSTKITEDLTHAIIQQDPEYTSATVAKQLEVKREINKLKRNQEKEAADQLREGLPQSLQRSMLLAQEKGASSWLTSLPIEEFGFTLHKSAFQDAIAIRYNWQPKQPPTLCGCGTKFSIEHSMSCPKGGFPSIRHNEIRDLTANLLTEVCTDVCVEPDLQPLTGEALRRASANQQDGARLDIAANGFWGGRYERTYVDVRIFNPHAPSHRQTNIATCYRKQEEIKKRAYEQRVREVEHSTFTPLVLSATGGMAPQATTFYKRLAACLADKWDQPYSSTMAWLRCRLSYSLLRSAIQSMLVLDPVKQSEHLSPSNWSHQSHSYVKSHPYHFTKYIFSFFISSSFINSCSVHVYLRTCCYFPPPKKKLQRVRTP